MQHLSGLLQDLPAAKRRELYESPWTCQALFRSLSALAQQYVLNLLFVDDLVPLSVVSRWPAPKAQEAHKNAVLALTTLGVLEQGVEGGTAGYSLHGQFKRQIRWAVAGGAAQLLQPVEEKVLRCVPPAPELDKYAQQHWEGMLLFLLGDPRGPPGLPGFLPRAPPLELHSLLEGAGLLAPTSAKGEPITDLGFKFLLQDTVSQMWTLLRQYVRQAELGEGSELSAVVSFLTQLGFRKVGQPFPFSRLTPLEQTIAVHMVQLGLLLPLHTSGAAYFVPTHLAASLCGGFVGGAATSEAAGGHIVVTSNYKVYAYTDSKIQKIILEFFCRNDGEMPNVFVGTITRESVLQALAAGISAHQIVTYLQQHAHAQRANRVPIVPEAVSDQIRLWEEEQLRLRSQPATMYDDFPSAEVFSMALAFAENHGVLLWRDALRFIVQKEAHPMMRNFIREIKDKPGG